MEDVQDRLRSGSQCIFTDGSGENGRVGAAAVMVRNNTTVIERVHLGMLNRRTVFESELVGILQALRITKRHPHITNVTICLDNQAAIARAHSPQAKSGQQVTTAIEQAVIKLRQSRAGFEAHLLWVPGHEGVEQNELADTQAKLAARGTEELGNPVPTLNLSNSAAALRAEFKTAVDREWKERWASSERGQRLARVISTSPSSRVAAGYRELKRADQALLTQLRTGHIALNAYLHRFGRVDSPQCLRCGEVETVTHFLLRCTRFSALRSTLRGQLRGQVMSVRTLLGVPKNTSALMKFVHATGRLQIRHHSLTQSSSPPS